MEQATLQHIHTLLDREHHILIVLPTRPSTDAIASGLALFSFLEKLNKRTKVVAKDFQLPPHHQFLPKSGDIASDLTSLQKFVISLDVSRTHVEELSYDIAGNALNIFVTPKSGSFTARDVQTSSGSYEYSLIITLDAPNLDALGELFSNNADFFYNTPIINIDHSASNGHFGQINLVDLTATSSSEIVFELIRAYDAKLLDEYIATQLLTGIISKTKSFQTASVTPKSLAIAGHLITSGARRDEIVHHLFQTKSVDTLRLWGHVLAKLQTAHEQRFVWSVLTANDISASGATADDIGGVIDELIVDTPKAEIIAVLYERAPGQLQAIVSTIHALNGLTIFRDFRPEGTKDFTTLTFVTRDVAAAEQQLRSTVKEHYAP